MSFRKFEYKIDNCKKTVYLVVIEWAEYSSWPHKDLNELIWCDTYKTN